MFYKFVNLPIFTEIGSNILDRFETILQENNLYFKKPLILTGDISGNIIKGYSFYNAFEKHHIGMYYDEDLIINIRKEIIDEGFDLIIGCGGGRIIDLGKYLSSETLTPFISIPTILSNDGVSSPISILRLDGSYRRVGSTMPIGVAIDINIIKSSPTIYLKAGLGDLISNVSAFYDWNLAYRRRKDRYDNFSAMMAYMAASNVLDKMSSYDNIVGTDFLIDLARGLVVSGISIAIARTSRPASGSEHSISHALDRILGPNRRPHGIQVGFATLLTLYLQGQRKLMESLKKFYRKVGFPVTFLELGISKETFVEAVKLAPSIRERYTILNEVSKGEIMEAIEEVYEG